MLKIYVKTGCPFCAKVIGKVDALGLQDRVEYLNIADEANRAALVEIGGQQQVPFLVDEERNVQMYESDEINTYLDQYYGDGGIKQEDVPPSEETDEVDER